MRQPQSDDLASRIVELERKISELSRSTLENVVVARGGIRLKGGGEFVAETPDGVAMFYLGELVSGVIPFRGMVMRREDGSAMFYTNIADNDPDKVFFSWSDRTGNILISDDASSGVGLARPWIPQAAINVLSSSIPMTSATTWVSTQSTGQFVRQQPKVEVEALLRSESGATGEARFVVNGVATGNVMTVAANEFAWQSIQTLALPGGYDSRVRVELQVQRTNGVGTIGGVFRCSQRQS